jgi:hypothetical protein
MRWPAASSAASGQREIPTYSASLLHPAHGPPRPRHSPALSAPCRSARPVSVLRQAVSPARICVLRSALRYPPSSAVITGRVRLICPRYSAVAGITAGANRRTNAPFTARSASGAVRQRLPLLRLSLPDLRQLRRPQRRSIGGTVLDLPWSPAATLTPAAIVPWPWHSPVIRSPVQPGRQERIHISPDPGRARRVLERVIRPIGAPSVDEAPGRSGRAGRWRPGL